MAIFIDIGTFCQWANTVALPFFAVLRSHVRSFVVFSITLVSEQMFGQWKLGAHQKQSQRTADVYCSIIDNVLKLLTYRGSYR